ncbi:hypothetical protein MNB_SV-10-132 [hydrothermal vent metagenome]|uniref:Methyltransferase type 11 domain-containing protein n=1 Tax=hydrothermal vent metagenome TaxID=652676 RepID=A0A1W1CTW4_9ZZZZ
MQEIIPRLETALEETDTVTFYIFDPDLGNGYAGQTVEISGTAYICRGLKAWVDLAELLKCRIMLPEKAEYPLAALTFRKLETHNSFHDDTDRDREEKYGVASNFFTIQKMEEPAFLYYYIQALTNAGIGRRQRILDLGVNRGDEFGVIRKMLNIDKYENKSFTGIDHSATATAYAKECFPEENVSFFTADITKLDDLHLGRFDLLVSIGTLQSPEINFKPFFMKLVQEYLDKEDSALILGFPNSRWAGGEMLYGAKAPNYAMSEMSLLFNDVMFCKKYLQQKKYRVTLTGKYYIFLTATKIGRNRG